MDINLTLVGQFITFAIFVWFTMKFVWPPITKALDERQTKIAAGLAAADRGVLELQQAQVKIQQQIDDAKSRAGEIIAESNKRAESIIDEARIKAHHEGERIIAMARSEIAQETETAKQLLRAELASLVIAGSEKIIGVKIDYKTNERLLEQLIAEI